MTAGPSAPKELAVPFAAHEAGEANEVLRAWIVDKGLRVSLLRGFDDPAAWGLMLTDIARHAARIYETEAGFTQAEALARIRSALDAEWDWPTDPGTTSSMQ